MAHSATGVEVRLERLERLEMDNALFSFMIESANEVSPACWKMMGALGAVILALAGTIAAMGMHVVKLHRVYGKKINELYDERIEDLKQNHSLVDTMIEVIQGKSS